MLDSFQNIFLLSQDYQFTTDELENASKESSASRLLHVAYRSKEGSTTNNKGVILIKSQNYDLLILVEAGIQPTRAQSPLDFESSDLYKRIN